MNKKAYQPVRTMFDDVPPPTAEERATWDRERREQWLEKVINKLTPEQWAKAQRIRRLSEKNKPKKARGRPRSWTDDELRVLRLYFEKLRENNFSRTEAEELLANVWECSVKTIERRLSQYPNK